MSVHCVFCEFSFPEAHSSLPAHIAVSFRLYSHGLNFPSSSGEACPMATRNCSLSPHVAEREVLEPSEKIVHGVLVDAGTHFSV